MRQCRVFGCGVLKEAKAGRITFAVALPRIQQARRRADKVRRLLRELGDTDEHLGLGERFLPVAPAAEPPCGRGIEISVTTAASIVTPIRARR